MILKNFFATIWLIKSPRSWRRLAGVLNLKEKIAVFVFGTVIAVALILLGNSVYKNLTEIAPAHGGTYVEGIVGSPRLLNPLFATSDADRDVMRLLFSTLFKYDAAGNLVGDLAENYSVSKDGKIYKITLKKNVFWQNGEPLTLEDVLFTIDAVTRAEYSSPLRQALQGVEVEVTGEDELTVKLKAPYANFIENLALLGILPKHIWASVQPKNFTLADYNLQPVGSGPYRFVKLQKDRLGKIVNLTLESNPNYFDRAPYIKNLILKFYDSEEEAVAAFNRKEIDGLMLPTAQNKNQLRGLGAVQILSLASSRIYGIFLNTDDNILKEKNVRLALNYAVNRQTLVDKVMNQEGKIAQGPIPPGLLGSSPEVQGFGYDPQKSEEILDKAGWTKNEAGTRSKKLNKDKTPTELRITIITTPNIQLIATLAKDDFEKIGIKTDLKILSIGEIQQDYYRTRQYQAILIGQSYLATPDPYSFWHSLARKEPGLNLSLYNNTKANKLIEDGRQLMDNEKRAQKYVEFQKIVLGDAPAVFLYSPNYLYLVSNQIKNIDVQKIITSSDRFSYINGWHISTKRVWK